jgi:hypothetical protein
LTGLRAFEQQITAAPTTATPQCQAPAEGPANSTDYITRLGAMFDVMEFAFRCDLTRVATFMFGNAFGPGPMPWIDVRTDYHNMTHAMRDAGNPERVAACIKWEVTQIAAFAKRLKAIPEGTRNVLYNTSFMVSSDVGEGAPHNHDRLPVLLLGNGGGAYQSGRHLAYAPEDGNARRLAGTRNPENRTRALAIPNSNKLANLHLSLLKHAGVPVDKVGDSTGPLRDL